MLNIEEINNKKSEKSKWTAQVQAGFNENKLGKKVQYVIAVCECGKQKRVLVRTIITGSSISCGCVSAESNKQKSYTIEDINFLKPANTRLTAIRFEGYNLNGKIRMVIAKCTCGNYTRITNTSLINGSSISCGCYKAECIRKTRKSITFLNKNKPENSRWTILRYSKRKSTTSTKSYVVAKCECGNVVDTMTYDILAGKSISCGCYNIEKLKQRVTKAYPVIPRLRRIYNGIINRCYDPNSQAYSNYGGRGVIVCEEWKNSYQSFLDWALSNGYKPELEIDKDKIGNGKLYSPETCCFLTHKENTNIRRTSKFFIYKGNKLNLTQICNLEMVSYSTIVRRLNVDKMTLIDALQKPIRKKLWRKLA